jgi:predicted metal-dependent hydrolase
MSQLELEFAAVPARTRAGTVRHLKLAAGLLPYRFVRAQRRTIGIVVRRGEVEARAPRYVTLAEVEAFLREKERWITRRLAEAAPEAGPFRWRDGAMLPVLGSAIRLTALPGTERVSLSDDRLLLPPHHPARWRELTVEWLRATALAMFHERMRRLAPVLEVSEPAIGLSNARTQWGSCRRKRGGGGRILLNWRLVHLPVRLMDYVVAHEMAHLRELNHSARFWAVVAGIFPEYRDARRELRRLGAALPAL